jgi:arginyl-tRNA synthetase
MSTRKGNIIFLEEVLDRAISLAKKIIEEKNPELKKKRKVAEMVAIGAVIFADLKNDRIKDIVFDWDKMLSFEGETGPYLQYTHARCCSVMRKAKKVPKKADLKFLSQPEETDVVKMLEKFPKIIEDAALHNKPHILANYLIALCQSFNNFYQKHTIISMENEFSDARIVLTDCVKTVLKTGIELLGIRAPKEM